MQILHPVGYYHLWTSVLTSNTHWGTVRPRVIESETWSEAQQPFLQENIALTDQKMSRPEVPPLRTKNVGLIRVTKGVE